MKKLIQISSIVVLLLLLSVSLFAKDKAEDAGNKSLDKDEVKLNALTNEFRYLPIIEKTLTTNLYSCYDWDIKKEFKKSNLQLLAGEKTKVNYLISVEKKAPKKIYFLKGDIKVYNTNPSMILYVKVNESVNGQDVKIAGVDESGYITVREGESVDLSYEVASEFKPQDGKTLTSLIFYKQALECKKDFSFSAVNQVAGVRNAKVSILDASNNKIWSDISKSVKLEGAFEVNCSGISETDFSEGKYHSTLNSYARILETGHSAYASVDVMYYAPVCSLKSKGFVSDAEKNHTVAGIVDIYNPHPSKEMKLEVSSYFNLKPLHLKDSVLYIQPQSKTNFHFSEIVQSEKYDYNDVQIYLNDIEFYLTEIINFHSKPVSNEQEMLLVSQ